jgi:PIN domain nuclease of toxin-antitoxin system
MFDDSNLSEEALKLIKSEKDVYVSIASLWEIAIKQSLGKLDIDVSIEQLASKCKEVDITILPIRAEHLDYIKILPDIHRDPFDRLIVSQAITENMVLVTRDTIIPKYDVNVVW